MSQYGQILWSPETTFSHLYQVVQQTNAVFYTMQKLTVVLAMSPMFAIFLNTIATYCNHLAMLNASFLQPLHGMPAADWRPPLLHQKDSCLQTSIPLSPLRAHARSRKGTVTVGAASPRKKKGQKKTRALPALCETQVILNRFISNK